MLEILLSSSVLILVLVLLRRRLRGRISARLQYALWALVLLRLLVPVTTFESKVSVAAVAQPISAQVQHYSELHVQPVYIPMNMGENPETGEPMEAVARLWVEPLDLLRWTWYAGMAAVGLWFLLENRRMMRLLKKGRQYYGSYESVPVYLCEGIPSPCLFGLFRPAIYLTEQAAADDTQAGQIMTHEYCHLCHGDLFWALLRSLCLVVWWFNPLVWWAAALSRRDGELACDESAIRRLGEDQRFDYGRTLLSLATVKLRPRDLLCGATTMTGGKNSLRERIEGIARTKKLSIGMAVLTLAIAAVTVGCTFAGSEDALTITPAAPVQTADPAPVPIDDVVILGEGHTTAPVLIFEETEATAVSGESFDSAGNLAAGEAPALDILLPIDPDQTAIQATLLDFINPAFAIISTDDNYVSDGTAFADMSFEDLLYSTDSWQVNSDPPAETGGSDTYIVLFDGEGGQLVIDAGQDEIRFYPYTQYYASYSIPGVSGSYFYDSLLEWASELSLPNEDPDSAYMQFITLAFTTDCLGRYSDATIGPPTAAAYEAFYEAFEPLCDTDFYYTMMLNREIFKFDEMAIQRGYRLTPNSCTYYGATKNEDSYHYEFMVFLDVATDDGSIVSGTISGAIETNLDGLVTGFVLDHGTVLNADPADDVLPVE